MPGFSFGMMLWYYTSFIITPDTFNKLPSLPHSEFEDKRRNIIYDCMIVDEPLFASALLNEKEQAKIPINMLALDFSD